MRTPRRHAPRRGPRLTALALTGVLLSGCGATIAPARDGGTAPNADAFPVTVTNCGKSRTFETPPQRVVTNDIGITEIMFALGLADRMAGYVLSDGQLAGAASSPWKDDFRRVPRIAERINKEVVRAAGADMVFAGWNYGFSETDRFTPTRLERFGIDSYVLTESCRSGHGDRRGIMPPLPALYHDIRTLGRLFGVPERAERLVADYRATVSRARASVPRGEPAPRVFLYDSGTSQPFTAGNAAAAHQIITKAGGRNVFGGLHDSWTSVSWESVIRADPQVIIVNDYGKRSAQQKIDFLTSYPPLSEVDAIQDRRFLVLPYASLVEGPRNPNAVRRVADHLWR